MTPTLAVRVQLPVGWNTFLYFNSDIVNFVWKTDDGEAESIVLLTFVLWRCFNRWWMRGGGRKSYLGPTETAPFSSRDFSMTHSDMYRLDISMFYFNEPLLFRFSSLGSL